MIWIPVSVDRHHTLLGLPHLRAHRRRHRGAHRAQTARVHPVTRPLEPPVLRRVHLVLPDAGDEDRVLAAKSRRRSTQYCGFKGRWAAGHSGGEVSFHSASWCSQAERSGTPPASSWRLATRPELADHVLAVAHDGTSTAWFFRSPPGRCRRGSILACGWNSVELPVTRSSKRAPSATRRSACCIAVTACSCRACRACPGSGSFGEAPSAIRVVMTGRPGRRRARRSSLSALGLDRAAADVEHRPLLQDQLAPRRLPLVALRGGL